MYGGHSTGKTTVVKAVLNEYSLKFFFVNCAEAFTRELVYTKVLQGLKTVYDFKDIDSVDTKNYNAFVNGIKTLLKEFSQKLVIVRTKIYIYIYN